MKNKCMLFVVLLLVTSIPAISLWLPRLFGMIGNAPTIEVKTSGWPIDIMLT